MGSIHNLFRWVRMRSIHMLGSFHNKFGCTGTAKELKNLFRPDRGQRKHGVFSDLKQCRRPLLNPYDDLYACRSGSMEREELDIKQVNTPLHVYIDGPFGAPTSQIFHAQHALLIGTGIGVTPFASILQSIMHRSVIVFFIVYIVLHVFFRYGRIYSICADKVRTAEDCFAQVAISFNLNTKLSLFSVRAIYSSCS